MHRLYPENGYPQRSSKKSYRKTKKVQNIHQKMIFLIQFFL